MCKSEGDSTLLPVERFDPLLESSRSDPRSSSTDFELALLPTEPGE